MEEMVEPDRTITIVSIIGLVIIWGSFFYHKFVQGGSGRSEDVDAEGSEGTADQGPGDRDPAGPATPEQPRNPGRSPKSSKTRGKKGR